MDTIISWTVENFGIFGAIVILVLVTIISTIIWNHLLVPWFQKHPTITAWLVFIFMIAAFLLVAHMETQDMIEKGLIKP